MTVSEGKLIETCVLLLLYYYYYEQKARKTHNEGRSTTARKPRRGHELN